MGFLISFFLIILSPVCWVLRTSWCLRILGGKSPSLIGILSATSRSELSVFLLPLSRALFLFKWNILGFWYVKILSTVGAATAAYSNAGELCVLLWAGGVSRSHQLTELLSAVTAAPVGWQWRQQVGCRFCGLLQGLLIGSQFIASMADWLLLLSVALLGFCPSHRLKQLLCTVLLQSVLDHLSSICLMETRI